MNKIKNSKNFILYYIYQITILLSTIVTTPYISKVLGSEKVGIYSYTFAIANLIYMFAQLGTYSYGVREISLNKNQKNALSKTFFEIFYMKLISTIIFIMIYLLLVNFQTNYKIYLLIWILYIASAAFDITWLYAGIEHFDEIFIINIIIRIIGIVLTFILIKNENDLWIYILIHALMYLLPFMLMWLSLYKYINIKQILSHDLIKHFKQALIYFIPTISASLFMVIDKTMLGFIIENKSESGYYEMASQIIIFSKTLSAIAISHVIQPKTTNYYKSNNVTKIKQAITTSIEFSSYLCIGMIFGIIAVAHDFVPIFFSSKFLPVENILKLMTPLILITSMSYIFEYEYLIPAGKGKSINKYIIISAIINITFNLILIKSFKSIGVVISSIFTEFLLLYNFYKTTHSIISINNIICILKNKLIAGIIMLFIIIFLDLLFKYIGLNNILLLLIIKIIMGILTYTFMLYILKDNIINFPKNFNKI